MHQWYDDWCAKIRKKNSKSRVKSGTFEEIRRRRATRSAGVVQRRCVRRLRRLRHPKRRLAPRLQQQIVPRFIATTGWFRWVSPGFRGFLGSSMGFPVGGLVGFVGFSLQQSDWLVRFPSVSFATGFYRGQLVYEVFLKDLGSILRRFTGFSWRLSWHFFVWLLFTEVVKFQSVCRGRDSFFWTKIFDSFHSHRSTGIPNFVSFTFLWTRGRERHDFYQFSHGGE